MIYVGDKKATPYYEDYKPVNVYRNNVKIAGWRVDEKSGTTLEWSDTYNDKVVSAVVAGASAQTVTVQGKNLFDGTIAAWIQLDGSLRYSSYLNSKATIKIPCSQNDKFILSWIGTADGSHAMVICFYDGNDVKLLRAVATSGNSLTAIAPTNTKYVRASAMDTTVTTNIQFELGTTATAYEPFVPNSPSPGYPSPIISTGEVSGIDLTVTGNAGQSYQVHRDMVLRSLPDGTHDTWDVVAGTVTRNVGVMVFDGTEASWVEYSQFITLLLSPAAVFSSILSPPLLCSHANMSINSVCWANASRLRVTMAYFGCNNLADWKAFLAAQYAAGTPVTVYYKLAAPTTEQIDPEALPTYPRYTMLNCNAEVTASVRVIEHGL